VVGLSLYENGIYVTNLTAIPNTGSYLWIVPTTYTGSNFQIESYLGAGQYAVSGMFSIGAPSSSVGCPMFVPYCPYGGHSVVESNGCTEEVCNAASTTSTPQQAVSFTRNLSYGDSGSDVQALQVFLVQANTGPAAQALQAAGETGTFGLLTKNALIEYQTAVGITPASGYFGSITRNWVEEH